MNIEQRLRKQLEDRKSIGTLRALAVPEHGLDFWSNDYLGYALDPVKSLQNGGSTGSRLISGNSVTHERLEKKAAQFFNSEAALLFNSGYDANVGLLSAIAQKNDVIIYDEDIHASMRDGMRLSLAKNYSFKHNSLEDLTKKLEIASKCEGSIFICIESLYSMRGDIAPIGKVVELARTYNAQVIVDEAHAAGVYGEAGRGIVSALGLENDVFARVITFGKAFGAHGAMILGSDVLIQFLVNFARSFIFTTALPKSAVMHIEENVFRSDFNEKRGLLFDVIHFFVTEAKKYQLKLVSEVNSPIQMLKVGDVKQTVAIAARLQENGFLVKAVVSPTVKPGDEALRVCLHAQNQEDDVSKLLALLKF